MTISKAYQKIGKAGLIAVLFLFSMFSAKQAEASHMAGGQITYTCIGLDSFEVTVKVFRYCAGINFQPTAINVTATSSCGGSTTVQLNRTTGPVHSGFDISQVCSSQSSNCQSGTATGYVELVFTGIFVLSPRCDCWTISYIPPCCRNGTVNTGGGSVYFETKVCNNTDTCNNSPTFSTSAIPYVCAGFPVSYNMGATDPDGDSLTYEFICARSNATTNLTYTSPYSCQNAINGITLDTLTGQIQFTATVTGAFIVVVQINEYDTGGNLIGTTMRDIQFRVETCSNTPPYDTLGIQNYTGVGFVNYNTNLIEVCLGDSFSFDVTVWDYVGYREDSLDTLLITSNVTAVLPGASFSINPINDSVHVVTIGWRAVSTGSPSNSFFIQTSDDACPVPGFTTSSYTVKVIPATEAGPNKIICKGVDTASVWVIGGTSVTWRVLSGDPLVYGGNFECDTTANDTCMRARFHPAVTTTYEVSSNLGQGCKTKDTITVFAVTDFNTITTNDTTICFSDSTIQIEVTTDTLSSFTYKWRPAGIKLDNDTIYNPMVTPIFSTQYTVTVTSDSGCIKKDTVNVYVTPPFPANIVASSDDSISCAGLSTFLRVDLGNNPQTCGLSSDACPGSLDYYTSTTTSNTNTATGTGPTAFPAPYGNSNRSARHQFLFRNSELTALGISNGMFESIGFYVVANSGTSVYNGFTIKMGCTPDTVLTGWHTNLYQVYNPKSTSITSGWNTHLFDQNFNYDGSSNVVLEICFDNTATAPTQSAQTAYTATTFNSCISNYSNTATCASGNIAWGSQVNRPNVRFSHCGAPDSAAYTFKWTPGNLVSFDTLKSPSASITQETTFKVIVTDTFGLCHDSSFATIKIATAAAAPDTTICPGDTITLRSIGAGICGGNALYAWNNGQYLDDDSVQFPKAVVYQTTQFVANVYDTCGCSLYDTITITVNPMDPPSALHLEPNCNAADGELTVRVNGGWAPFSYSIDTGTTYSLDSNFQFLTQGYYSYVVIDSLGCVSDTTHDTLLMKGAPVIDSLRKQHISCFDFLDGEIGVYADPRGGTLPLEYSVDSGQTWTLNNPIQGLKADGYIVMARSATGCVSLPYIDTLTQPTRLELFVDTVGPDLCNQLGMGQVSVHAGGGVTPYRFVWSNGSSDTLNDSLLAGTYTLALFDDHNCLVPDTFEIREPDKLLVRSLEFDPVSCFGYSDGRIIVHGVGGYDQGWPLRNDKKDTIPFYEFSIDGGATFQGPDLFNTNDSSSFSGLKAGTYSIVIKDQAGCETFGTIDITEPPVMTIDVPQDSFTLCVSNCVDLSASAGGGNSGGYTYHWSPDLPQGQSVQVCPELPHTVYTVYASDSKFCNSPAAFVNVYLYDSLEVITSNDTDICSGTQAQLFAEATGGDGNGFNFEWQPFIGLSNAFVHNPSARPDQTTDFTVKVTDNCGSPSVTATVRVNVLKDPGIAFQGVELAGCEPLTVEFTNLSTLPGAECFWVFGKDTVFSCEDVDYEFENSGLFDVSLYVMTEAGCEGIFTAENYIDVYQKPLASFEMSPNPTTFLNTNITVVDRSEGEIIDWSWQFADFGESEKRNTTFEFPEDTGSYPIRLEVVNANMCVDDTVQNLVIASEYLLYVPSSFTPNGDGTNELWKPEGIGIESDQYFVWVYDRWGKVIWESTDFYEAWDGIDPRSGEVVNQGTYTWKIITGDLQNKRERHEYFGTVTVLR